MKKMSKTANSKNKCQMMNPFGNEW